MGTGEKRGRARGMVAETVRIGRTVGETGDDRYLLLHVFQGLENAWQVVICPLIVGREVLHADAVGHVVTEKALGRSRGTGMLRECALEERQGDRGRCAAEQEPARKRTSLNHGAVPSAPRIR